MWAEAEWQMCIANNSPHPSLPTTLPFYHCHSPLSLSSPCSSLLPSCPPALLQLLPPPSPHCLPSVKVLLILSHTVVMVGSVVTLCNVSLSDICICMM